MNIIISPHSDDELIGCFSLIKKGMIDEVIHIDPDPKRFALAEIVGKELGFNVTSLTFRYLVDFLKTGHPYTYFVPDVADNHLLHKAINCVARLSGCRLGYFSTDMNTGYVKELSAEMKREKLLALNKFYPDQASLWGRDWKYFLFEGVVAEFPLEG